MTRGQRSKGRYEEMAPTVKVGGDVATGKADARRKLNDDLREIGERLRIMVDAYQEKPGIIDGDVLNDTDHASDIETTITEVYRIMKTYVYAEDNPLRVDDDLWEASREQKDEFIGFYTSALMALETYREVLRAYSLLKGEAGLRPQRGDLERIRQDEHARVKERARCIEAISHFQGKFSATLTVLCSIS
jgi:hypothetical protein